MDWTKLLKAPLPTVLVVLGCVLAAIAAAGGRLSLGNIINVSSTFDSPGRIGVGLLGVLLCVAGIYLGTAAKLRLRDAPPEFTLIQLKPECKSWIEAGGGRHEFRRNFDYPFAEDPVFQITVTNRSSSRLLFYKAGVRLVRREPERAGTMGSWEHRTLDVQAELSVRCPDEWKRIEGVIDDKHSRASKAFAKPVELNRGTSRYLFTLELENFVDPDRASSSEIRLYLVTGNNRTAESESIWLYQ